MGPVRGLLYIRPVHGRCGPCGRCGRCVIYTDLYLMRYQKLTNCQLSVEHDVTQNNNEQKRNRKKTFKGNNSKSGLKDVESVQSSLLDCSCRMRALAPTAARCHGYACGTKDAYN